MLCNFYYRRNVLGYDVEVLRILNSALSSDLLTFAVITYCNWSGLLHHDCSDSPLGVNGSYKGRRCNGLIVISQCLFCRLLLAMVCRLLLIILVMLGIVLPGQEVVATATQLLTCRFHRRQSEHPARRKPAPQR